MPRFSLFAFLVALPLFCLVFATPPAVSAAPVLAARQTPSPTVGAKKRLTLDEAEDPALAARWSGGGVPGPSFLRWLPDGAHYLEVRAAEPGAGTPRRLFFVDARSGRSEPVFDPERIERAFAALPGVTASDARAIAARAASGGYPLSDDAAHVLITHANDLWVYHRAADQAVRVTNTPNEAEELAAFSPNARRVAFVKNNNLFVAPADPALGNNERALTTDGSPNVIFNGRLDWVYDEEIYGRGTGRAFWWSPDSARIAFLRLDETPVRAFAVVNHLPRGQETENTPYPLPGDPNPLAKLGVVGVAEAGPSPVWMDTSAYAPADLLLVRVAWTPDAGQIVFQAQNREQTFLDLLFANPATGRARRVLRDTTPAWVEADAEPRFLRDGTFLWLSERTGFKHLYHYRADGTLIAALTKGDWEVRALNAVDESNGFVYVTGTRDSAIAENVYRIALAGAANPVSLTASRAGSHRADFSPTGALYRDSWSSLTFPMQSALFAADSSGALVRTFTPARAPGLSDYALGTPEKHQVKTRDGFVMNALLLKPADFDPAKKYPVFCRVYAGPNAPQVADRWGTFSLWDHYLAQQGYLVWLCDNRSASGQGAQSAWTSFKNFGEQELKDIEDGLAYLKRQPWVDPARIGIYGWSFGGYMTAYALTHSTSFKMGIAGAPVTDWSLYDSIYTERYMGVPARNPEGYKKSAAVSAAANLSGRLLLLHGTLDDNVHVQNTVQFAYALQKAGKSFEMMLYPASRHGIGDPQLRKHLSALRTRFILENL